MAVQRMILEGEARVKAVIFQEAIIIAWQKIRGPRAVPVGVELRIWI